MVGLGLTSRSISKHPFDLVLRKMLCDLSYLPLNLTICVANITYTVGGHTFYRSCLHAMHCCVHITELSLTCNLDGLNHIYHKVFPRFQSDVKLQLCRNLSLRDSYSYSGCYIWVQNNSVLKKSRSENHFSGSVRCTRGM